jgi:predicted nucleic acid-binding protein
VKLFALDASAWLRLFLHDGPLPDALDAAATDADSGISSFVAPELILVEAAHALHRKRQRGQISNAELKALWTDMQRTPVDLMRHGDLMATALALAGEQKLTVYDALYLAVARHVGAPLFTMDDDLAAAAKRCNLLAK